MPPSPFSYDPLCACAMEQISSVESLFGNGCTHSANITVHRIDHRLNSSLPTA